MNDNTDETIASYLLDELGEGERAEFERRLGSDPALRAEVDSLRPVLARLERVPATAWDPQPPPQLALPVSEVRDAPVGRRRRRWAWNPQRVAIATGLASLLLGAGIWIGTALDRDTAGEQAPEELIALRPVGEGRAGASGELAVVRGGEGPATLRVSGLDPNGDDYYEAWLLGDRGLVPLGSFRVGADGTATVDLRIPVDASRYQAFDVSLEPDDGDPAHSTVSVLRGPTAL